VGVVLIFGLLFGATVVLVAVDGGMVVDMVVDVDVVVEVDVIVGRWRPSARGVAGEEVDVNVKTNTTRSRGLDHITRCALRSEGSLRAMVLKGYRCWR
jgi:hypothetical protein